MPHDDISNSVEDASGQFVQAGKITGGVHFHQPSTARPASVLPLRVGLVPLLAGSFQQRSTADQLARTLDQGDTAILTSDGVQATVLSGLGGVGKTQLAADYAERMWAAQAVRLLVWVIAGSREAVVSTYATVAARLTGEKGLVPEEGARRFLEWLAQTKQPWLVVLDDLHAPADISGLWPPTTEFGRTVVTTRRRDAALRGHRRQIVEVGVFSEAEALSYLRSALADQPSLLTGADDLVHDLGCLPLALAQAGAYLIDRHLSCDHYRVRLAKRRLAHVVPEPDGLPDEHRTTLAATWSLSVEQADLIPPVGVARPLLDVASVLAPNGIPIGVFTSPIVLMFLSAETGRFVSAFDARDGLGCLHRLSLITVDTESVSQEVRVHALVQRATRDMWPDGRAAFVVRIAADGVWSVWPKIENDPMLEQVLRANADALIEIDNGILWQHEAHPVLIRAGTSLGRSGLVTEARIHFDALKKKVVRDLRAGHDQTLKIRYNIAFWQREAGDPGGATTTFEELLVDALQLFGPHDPRTLAIRSNLAASRGESGDSARETAELEQLLIDIRRVLGPNDPDTLSVRNLLARNQIKVGKSAEAVVTLEQLLSDRIQVLGPDHPDTLITRGNLAYARGGAGDQVGAIAALEQLLTDQTRVLGHNHPDVGNTRSILAMWRGVAGDPTRAAADYRQLLADFVPILGREHPLVADAGTNLTIWQQQADNVSD